MLTCEEVRKGVADCVAGIIGDCKDNTEIGREKVIERLDEECDELFWKLVRYGWIDEYGVDDLVATAQQCAAIVKVAKEDAWIEDDHGLWDGQTYGVLASITYFSLRNLLYKKLAVEGYDSNEERPFAVSVDSDVESASTNAQ